MRKRGIQVCNACKYPQFCLEIVNCEAFYIIMSVGCSFHLLLIPFNDDSQQESRFRVKPTASRAVSHLIISLHMCNDHDILQVLVQLYPFWNDIVNFLTNHGCTDLFICNTVHIRSYNVKSHWNVQGRNFTPEERLESLKYSRKA